MSDDVTTAQLLLEARIVLRHAEQDTPTLSLWTRIADRLESLQTAAPVAEVERLLGIIVRNGVKYQAMRDELIEARANIALWKRWYESEKLRADTLELARKTDPMYRLFGGLR